MGYIIINAATFGPIRIINALGYGIMNALGFGRVAYYNTSGVRAVGLRSVSMISIFELSI